MNEGVTFLEICEITLSLFTLFPIASVLVVTGSVIGYHYDCLKKNNKRIVPETDAI